VRLPLWVGLEHQDRIIDTIHAFFKQQ
jgi:hypothetical protein